MSQDGSMSAAEYLAAAAALNAEQQALNERRRKLNCHIYKRRRSWCHI